MTTSNMVQQLDAVFRARSVAIVGISANERKLNGAPLGILETGGFKGPIYLVNPKYSEIRGRKCYASISELPEAPDVAVILVPARDVPATVEECGRKGTRAAVVISSGFEEVSNAAALVGHLKEVCRQYGIALVGPNCEGVWSVRSRVLLTFGSAAKRPELFHAPVAILSQSGSLAGGVARHLQDSGFGCAYVVSVGNETVVSILDYLDYMLAQDDVRVVLLFIEGLKDGQRLLELAARARARGVVLVVLKSGNSVIGREAAASHTGKASSPYAIYRDVFEQAGILQVAGLTELIEAAELFTSLPLPRVDGVEGQGLSVYSIPGGTRALTVDLCEQAGVPLTVFAPQTVAGLTRQLPDFGYAKNPTDITGAVLSAPELFDTTLTVVADDPGTRALLVQLANRGPHDLQARAELLEQTARSTGVPVIITFLGDALDGKTRRTYAAKGLYCARDPQDAVRYLGWLFRVARWQADAAAKAATLERATTIAMAPPVAAKRGWADAVRVLESAGVALPGWVYLKPGETAEVACASLRFPVAVKALPEDVEHKTERGLVKLNLSSFAEVESACAAIRQSMQRPDATLLAQEMVSGVEAVVAVMRNDDFGAVLAIGTGGIFVELMQDMSYVALPASIDDIERLVDRLALARLLGGFRGAPEADRSALVAAAKRLADAFCASTLREIELNPVMVRPKGQGIVAVDVLMN